MISRTLVLLKPDAVQRQITGQIIQRFENVGLKIVGMKMVWVDRDFAKQHYAAHVGKSFYETLENFIVEGPVIALALEGINAVALVRKMVGATEPAGAAPGTIRADFAMHTYQYADAKGISIKNLIHASGTDEEGKQEVALWFGVNELHNYKTVHEKHVL